MTRAADPTGWAARYAAGETLRAVAAGSGFSASAVRKRLLGMGVVLRRGGGRPGAVSPRLADSTGWAERYAAGETLRAIAASAGVSHACVHRHLALQGVERRSSGVKGRRPRPEWHARAVEMRRQGLLHKQIAHEVGRARAVVTRVLRRAGVS